MRFNAKELAHVALEQKGRCEKEGILHIRERQDGLFKKGEVYTERWCRLRGNLLFYFKAKDPSSEAAGVIVLERCVVELDPDEELDFSFVLVFEGDDKVQYLAANTERERDTWIEALHIASYECMKIQLQSLREQLRARTGKDPIDNPEPSVLEENKPDTQDEDTEPMIEMCVSCKNIPNISGRPPNCYASFSTVTPPQQTWMRHGQTEIREKSNNPNFMTTIGFGSTEHLLASTRIRITVFDVKERMTNTTTQIGSVIFSMEDLLGASSNRLTLTLSSAELTDAGEVTVMGWQNETVAPPPQSQAPKNSLNPPESPALFGVTKRGSSKKLDMLRPMYANIIRRTYQFPTNEGGPGINVHEYMGESRYTYHIPRELLKLWIEEEKSKIVQLQELNELLPEWSRVREEIVDYHMSTISMYTQKARYLATYSGTYFKPSVKKSHRELEFVPTNLHLQRMWVQNDAKSKGACYDVTTVGAFTAFATKYKNGGLRRLMQQLRDKFTATYEGRTKLEKIGEIVNCLEQLRQDVHFNSEGLCRAALQGDIEELKMSTSLLSDKTRQTILLCENSIVEEGVQNYHHVKLAKNSPRPQSENLHRKEQTRMERDTTSLVADTYRWSGTDFVQTPTEEPFDMTRLNTEAGVMCIVSKVEDLCSSQTNSGKWLEDLSPLVINLKSCVEILSQKARAGLTFLTLQEMGGHVAQLHTIKYRRDVVFSQALTSLISAFVTKLRTNMTHEAFLKQLGHIGVLVQFESLLSCHSDEQGMLDDMIVAVADLSHVQFKVECCMTPDQMTPTVQGNRTGYIVKIPVPQHMFILLPIELQRGHNIKVIPTLFTMGINEQATLAEKFGDTSLQEMVNVDGFRTLYHYYEKYAEIIGDPGDNHQKKPFSVEELARQLNYNVMAKKSKNVEILHLAAEICHKINGIRFTSCKSAKDRTAMSVTLEQCQILQREGDLASHSFTHALECMRSEGVRRENTLKNTGTRKYAFNSLQLLSIPKLYRPPQGTFGNSQT